MSVEVSAATAAAAGGRSLFGSTAATGFIALAFDPDDREDQDGARRSARTAIDAQGLASRSLPPRRRIRRKCNDGAHNKTLSDRRTDMIWPAIAIIKNRTWLTAS
jgi:hypothetical protein